MSIKNDDDNNNINLKNYKSQYVLIFISILVLIYILSSKSNQNKILKDITYFQKHKDYINIIIFIILSIFLQIILHWQGITSIICGYLYGFKYGYVLSLIITLISTNITYFLSKINTREESTIIINKDDSLKYVILSRILPHHLTSIFWGTTNVKYKYFIIGTLIPLIFLLAVETYIGTIIDFNQLKKKIFGANHITILIIVIIIVLIIFILYKVKIYYKNNNIDNIIISKIKEENNKEIKNKKDK